MKRKIILLTFEDLGLGGIQTKIIDIANTLSSQQQYKIIIFLKHRSSFDRSSLLKKDIHIIYCPQIFPNFIKARYYYALLFLLVFIKPEAIFVSLQKQSIFVLYWKKLLNLSIRVIVNIDTYLKMHQDKNEMRMPWLLTLIGQIINLFRLESVSFSTKLFNFADSVIAVSRTTYSDLYDRLRITVPPLILIPNWTLVQSRFIKNYQQRKNSLTYIGRLAAQKRPELIINFMEELVKFGKSNKVYVFGDGPLKDLLERKIRGASLETNFVLSKPTINARKILANTRFVLLTSKYEGLPFIILEAMSQGCVVLALEAPGVSELVIDQETGVCKRTVAELVEAYLYLSGNDKAYLALQRKALIHQKEYYGRKNLDTVIKLLES